MGRHAECADLRLTALGDIGATMAQVARLLPNGDLRLTADLGTYEAIANPDDDLPDSNPFGILVLPGRRILSLPEAACRAGVGSVLAALWPVQDAAAMMAAMVEAAGKATR